MNHAQRAVPNIAQAKRSVGLDQAMIRMARWAGIAGDGVVALDT